MKSAAALLLLGLTGAALLPAGPSPQDRRCTFRIRNVDRYGIRTEPTPGAENYFAGGNVWLECIGQNVHIRADSLASYQGTVVQFIGHVRYSDSTTGMTADFGTYFRDGDRWEARGNVVYTNKEDGSTLRGPTLDYYRPLAGSRPIAEMYADQRPTIRAVAKDSTADGEEPYLIVGDRVRIRGNDQFWAGGRVTIDRSDLRGRGDSLYLDTGPANAGLLLGRASLRRMAADSFSLDAERIDLGLERRALKSVYAQERAHLVGEDLEITADSIRLALEARKVDHTEAWGDSTRATASSADYRIVGDSLAIDTPGQRLSEVRAFGKAWAGLPADSAGATGDWIAGNALRLVFAPDSVVTGQRATLKRLDARSDAKAYFRVRDARSGGLAITYMRADTILVTMRGVGDAAEVEDVRAIGLLDGVQLQPILARTVSDTGAATVRRPRP